MLPTTLLLLALRPILRMAHGSDNAAAEDGAACEGAACVGLLVPFDYTYFAQATELCTSEWSSDLVDSAYTTGAMATFPLDVNIYQTRGSLCGNEVEPVLHSHLQRPRHITNTMPP